MAQETPGVLRDWESEAKELRLVVAQLRKKILALAKVLPLDSLRFLEADPDTLESEPDSSDFLDGFEDDTRIVPSDVATEVRMLWARLAQRGGA